MKPLFHPHLVNGACGDPALYIECMFEHRALLFDLGEVAALAPRRILRLSHVFVSHAHMDHFGGFDRILRICLGRDTALHVFGPPGFVDQVAHRLAGYTWNLVRNYDTDFVIVASELHADGRLDSARFRCRKAFEREALESRTTRDGVLLDEEAFRVRAVTLDHKTPCLAFALEERQHINVWKNRLDALGLTTGPWLRELKLAVLRGEDDAHVFDVDGRRFPLGELKRELLHIVPGQRIAYVVDAAYHEHNASRIVDIAHGADVAFIEAHFLDNDAARAAETAHLTAAQAGRLAHRAGVRRLVPFHFSTRYSERPEALEQEALRAFGAQPS